MFRSFKARFVIPVIATVAGATLIGAYGLANYLSYRETSNLEAGVAREVNSLRSSMIATASLMDDRAYSGLAVLRAQIDEKGVVTRGQAIEIEHAPVPDLKLANKSFRDQTIVLEDTVKLVGGSAAVYTRDGSHFVSLGTTLHKTGGAPATGSRLESSSGAAAALLEGKPFHGMLEQFGRPYFAALEPIFDETGQVIGATYFGYLADFSVVRQAVDNAKILDSGHLLVFDAKGVVRYHKDSISELDANRLLINKREGWEVKKYSVPEWNYSIVAGFPKDELSAPARRATLIVLVAGALLSLLVSGVMYVLLDKNVLRLLGGEPTLAAEIMHTIATGDLVVEIPQSASDGRSLMSSLRVLQMKLRNITRSIQEPMVEVSRDFNALTAALERDREAMSIEQCHQIDSSKEALERSLSVLQRAVARLKL